MRNSHWIQLGSLVVLLSGCGQDVAAPNTANDASPSTPSAQASADTAGSGAQPPPPSQDSVDGTAMASAVDPASATTTAPLSVSGGDRAYLVDPSGSAVYYMEGNRDGTRCDADCERAWPPVIASDGQTQTGSGIEAGQVSTLSRASGGRQVMYDGQPLYRYAGDQGAGRTSGEGIKDKWGQWQLATPKSEKKAAE